MPVSTRTGRARSRRTSKSTAIPNSSTRASRQVASAIRARVAGSCRVFTNQRQNSGKLATVVTAVEIFREATALCCDSACTTSVPSPAAGGTAPATGLPAGAAKATARSTCSSWVRLASSCSTLSACCACCGVRVSAAGTGGGAATAGDGAASTSSRAANRGRSAYIRQRTPAAPKVPCRRSSHPATRRRTAATLPVTTPRASPRWVHRHPECEPRLGRVRNDGHRAAMRLGDLAGDVQAQAQPFLVRLHLPA